MSIKLLGVRTFKSSCPKCNGSGDITIFQTHVHPETRHAEYQQGPRETRFSTTHVEECSRCKGIGAVVVTEMTYQRTPFVKECGSCAGTGKHSADNAPKGAISAGVAEYYPSGKIASYKCPICNATGVHKDDRYETFIELGYNPDYGSRK